MNEKMKVLKPHEYEQFKSDIKYLAESFHGTSKPAYIFLTERSAIPVGFALKSALKEAYPNEPLPKFYRITPNPMSSESLAEETTLSKEKVEEIRNKGIKSYFKKRIAPIQTQLERIPFSKEKGHEFMARGDINGLQNYIDQIEKSDERPKILVLDEQGNSRKTMKNAIGLIKDSLTKLGIKGYSIGGRYGGGYYEQFPVLTTKLFGKKYLRDVSTEEEKHNKKKRADYLTKGEFTLTGGIAPRNLRPGAYKFVKELKELGREVGEELRKEREAKKKTLDETIGIISIAGFIFSILSFSRISGNVIGNSTTSNIVGVVFFLVGIVGAFFYFRRR